MTSVEPSEKVSKKRLWSLGVVAFAIAAVLALLEAFAIYLASAGQALVGTAIAQVLTVLTALPIALGVLAIIRRRDRDWGIAAILVAIAANPLILFNILGLFGGR